MQQVAELSCGTQEAAARLACTHVTEAPADHASTRCPALVFSSISASSKVNISTARLGSPLAPSQVCTLTEVPK